MSPENPEKWHQVKETFYAALRLPPAERERFLNEACKGEEDLRREVESLLSSSDAAGSFMQDPAVAAVADAVAAERSKQLSTGQIVGHYKILRELGAGGMGEVFLAQDTKLDRKAALKILPQNFARDAERMRRFVREAKSTSALNHPNIVTVYEIGEIDSTHFIAAEYIEGETLYRLLRREPVSLESVLEITVQVASALHAAHNAGIVHRDIKTDNVMIRPDGLVKILDFGIAKLTEKQSEIESDSEAATAIKAETSPGVIIGTVNYMSPEQARGKVIDGRTDIFSFGVMLYEMLTGKLPFQGENAIDVIGAILHKEPVPLNQLRPDIPRELERIVSKALRKDREERYQTAKDLLIDLKDVKQDLEFQDKLERAAAPRREGVITETFNAATQRTSSAEYIAGEVKNHKLGYAIAMTILLSAAAGLGYWGLSNRSAAIGSIAVLPFVNESGSADVEYLSDGMTETLITSLSQLPGLKVKARSSVFRYKGRGADAQAAGKELNVQAILTGRFVQRGDDLTLFLSLVDATNGNNLWSNQYHRKLTNLITLQSDIARDVANNLGTRLSGADERMVAKNYTENVEAYQLYLKGRYHILTTRQSGAETGISYYRLAIGIDPNYALAHAGLAEAALGLAFRSEQPSTEAFREAKEAANRAVEIDGRLVEAHVALGHISHWYDWDWNAAENHLKRALEIDANNAQAHLAYGALLFNTGRRDEGLAHLRRCVELDPLPLNLRNSVVEGQYLNFAGRPDEALARLQRVFELEPNFYLGRLTASQAYIEKGMFPGAIAEARAARQLNSVDSTPIAFLGYAYAKSGNQREARNLLEETLKLSEKRYVTPYNIAMIYQGLDERGETLRWLERGLEQRDLRMTFLKAEPKWNNLRSDARFQEIMRRVGLPQ